MNAKYLQLAVFLAIPVVFGAEDGKDGAIDIEARKATIPLIETHIQEREARMTELGNDILAIHRRIDARLGQMVARLATMRDSTKSRYRVSKAKMKLINDLREAIEAYQSKRTEIFEDIRRRHSGIPKEILEVEAAHYDEYAEKHLKQIIALSKSFTQDEDVEKYERNTGGGYYIDAVGWGWESGQISDEYRQNRRDRVMNKKQREEVIDALKGSAERCESLIASLNDDLKNRSLTKADRELMREELARHTAMLARRRAELDDLTFVEKPETSPVSRDAALDLEDSLEDLTEDLRNDLRTIFTKHVQLRRERFKIYQLQRNLAARKKWLEEHESQNRTEE